MKRSKKYAKLKNKNINEGYLDSLQNQCYRLIDIIMKKCDTLDFKQIEDNLLKVIKEKL